jgi:siroheme synthase-like protein
MAERDAEPGRASVYPLFLKLAGRLVLVVGAGDVAERKVGSLLGAGARVVVVAPHATATIERLAGEGALTWRARPFEEADAEGAWLIVAATSDAGVQRRVAAASEARRVFVVAVDDPGNASAYSGAIVERPPFTVALSSSGATPALTRLLRELIEQILPGDEWVEHARRLRAKWLADGTPMSDRFGELVREFKRPA